MKVSLILASRSRSVPVRDILASISRLRVGTHTEVILATGRGQDIETLPSGLPNLSIVKVDPGASLAQTRHAAVQQSRGKSVAMLNERYTVDRDWMTAVERFGESSADVLSGPVRPPVTPLTTAQWAMYLSEYSHLLRAFPRGPLGENDAAAIPGGNVVYKRRVFDLARLDQALWELDFHRELHRAGACFVFEPGFQASLGFPYTLDEYLEERRRVSRDFASFHSAGFGPVHRAAIALSRLALPPLITARVTHRTWRDASLRGRLAASLPWIVRFGFAQMSGEIEGIVGARSG